MQILEGLPEALNGRFLRLAQPNTRVIELLVGLVRSFRVSNLSLQVIVLLLLKLADTIPAGPLDVGIDVHLDDSVLDSGVNLVLLRPGPTVEHKVDRLVLLALQLLLDVLLGVAEDVGPELNISRLVHSVNVSEGGRDGEHGVGDGSQGLVDLPDLVRLRVEGGVVNILVVHTVLLTTSDSELHLQQAVHLGHAGHVLDTELDVLVQRLLRQINHVRAEEGLSMLLEVLLISVQHSVKPGKELLGAVIRVENDRNSVMFGHQANMMGARDGSKDASLEGFLGVVQSLSSVELRSSVGELDHNRAVVLLGCLQHLVDTAGGNTVDRGNSESLVLGGLKEVLQRLASDNSRLDGVW
mmetsp:Transcript_16018/g.36590  ORF Transcript_16018/g.36590 Transcript_16018/m.36590 type:complete len:354 (+) Transcript_16018:1312-2373(+)